MKVQDFLKKFIVISLAATMIMGTGIEIKVSATTTPKASLSASVTSALVSKAKISATTAIKGQKITLTGSASGGSGSYKYAYFYKKYGVSSWITIKNYSKATSATIKIPSAAIYNMCVRVKDSKGTIKNKYFTVDSTLKLNAGVSASSINVGSKVNITASAKGGTGSYTYAYYYKKSSDKTWTQIKGYSSAKSVSFTPKSADAYSLKVYTKDTGGTIISKTLNVKVKVQASSVSGQINTILDKIITDNMSEFDKVKAIHDWLVKNVEYDVKAYQTGEYPDSDFTVSGLLSTHIAVCDGYAKTFLQMAKQAGLNAERITGNATDKDGNSQSHAWNQVQVDGKWYNIDVTWDDPVITGVSDNSNIRYNYFLVPDSVLNKDHSYDFESSSIHHSCTTAQPKSQIVNGELNKVLAEHSNYKYAASQSEMKSEMAAFAKQKVYDFCIIYYKANSSANYIINNDASNSIPSGYGANMNIRNWIFDDYYIVNIKLS